MKEPEESPLIDDYRRLLRLLTSNLQYLQTAGVEPRTLESYRRLLRYLRARPVERIPELLGQQSKGGRRDPEGKSIFTDDAIRSMTAEQVRKLASEPKVTRKDLERIAVLRFGMTTGGLSNLRNREALVEKLLTLVSNESTHDSIARIVDSASSQHKK